MHLPTLRFRKYNRDAVGGTPRGLVEIGRGGSARCISAPDVCVDNLRVSFGWIAWKNMMEFSRGGAYVPARVALQGRIHHYPAHNASVFGMETPLRGRSGGHIGTAPTVSFGWIACGWFCLFGGLRVDG